MVLFVVKFFFFFFFSLDFFRQNLPILRVEKRDSMTRSCCVAPPWVRAPRCTNRLSSSSSSSRFGAKRPPPSPNPQRKSVVRCADDDENDDSREASNTPAPSSVGGRQQPQRGRRNARQQQADSTDAVATFLTRRFGLKGGVAWLGLLTFGVVSEQVKTRRETREEKANTRKVAKERRRTTRINEWTSYEEIVEGGGEYVQQGFLCGAHVSVKNLETNETVFDTRKNNRPIGFVYSKTRPPPVLPRDVNESFSDDRYIARNGTRRVFTTTSGDDGLTFTDGSYVAPNVRVEIDFEFTKVSIPPS